MNRNVQILSDYELNVIRLLAEGYSQKTISKQMKTSEEEVNQLLSDILRKQGFASSFELIHWAYEEAIIS